MQVVMHTPMAWSKPEKGCRAEASRVRRSKLTTTEHTSGLPLAGNRHTLEWTTQHPKNTGTLMLRIVLTSAVCVHVRKHATHIKRKTVRPSKIPAGSVVMTLSKNVLYV